jgi:predicted Na+-dependent transporter
MQTVLTPEVVTSLIALIALVLASFFPEFKEEINAFALAVSAFIISVFLRGGIQSYIVYKTYAASQGVKDC